MFCFSFSNIILVFIVSAHLRTRPSMHYSMSIMQLTLTDPMYTPTFLILEITEDYRNFRCVSLKQNSTK